MSFRGRFTRLLSTSIGSSSSRTNRFLVLQNTNGCLVSSHVNNPTSLQHQHQHQTGRCLSSSSSKQVIVINAVGKDRVGIVSDVSKYVTEVGGNVGGSQAAKLGDHFSMMMLVQLASPEQKEALKAKLKSLQDINTTMFETQLPSSSPASAPKVGYSGYFKLDGADHPGIVHKLTALISKNGLNIDKLETKEEIAPHGGVTLFKVKGIATAFSPLAENFNVPNIKKQMSDLGDSLNCDITMKDLTISTKKQ